MFSFISRFSAVLMLSLAMSTQAAAMTVFDVIQLSKKSYSDQAIISLIENTESAFELKAEDISRLVELGVSEPVIQVMLKALPIEPAAQPTPDTAPDTSPDENKSGSEPSITYIASAKVAGLAAIDSEPLTESGSGGHHHQVITLSGLRLFALRDEGNYPSVTARANAIAANLRAASAMASGQFQAVHVAGRDAVMFTAAETNQSIIVVTVSPRDASAYQRRSGRRVTADILAAYWGDLLTDYWSLTLGDQPPDRLTALHNGEALQKLYAGMDTSIDDGTDRLSGAFQLLPKQQQQHLLQLAVLVPHDFNANDEHEGETR